MRWRMRVLATVEHMFLDDMLLGRLIKLLGEDFDLLLGLALGI